MSGFKKKKCLLYVAIIQTRYIPICCICRKMLLVQLLCTLAWWSIKFKKNLYKSISFLSYVFCLRIAHKTFKFVPEIFLKIVKFFF